MRGGRWSVYVSDRRLRFAVVMQTPKDAQSAVYIAYQSLAAALEHRGHSVTIMSPADVRALRSLSGRWVPFAYPLAIASWLRGHRNDFDLVMFHSSSGWLASAMHRGHPRALVMFHGVEPMYHDELRRESELNGERLSWRYRFLQETVMPLLLSVACRTASGVVCLNQAEGKFLVSRRWVAPKDLRVLAHGVPPEFFLPSRGPRAIRSLLFVGQWLPMKGIRYLREAAITLLDGDPDLQLICAGTLAPEATVKAEFPDGIHHRVTVLPRVEQPALARLYRDADLFIFPSLYEGFSRAIVEAMASRLPIVCTSVGVASDTLRHNQSAVIVPKHDSAALVAAVRRIQSDSTLAQRLSMAAGEAAQGYALAAVLSRTIGMIVEAAERVDE
jgi:glycosyltransferase involved in cell wall biosynthesis